MRYPPLHDFKPNKHTLKKPDVMEPNAYYHFWIQYEKLGKKHAVFQEKHDNHKNLQPCVINLIG